MLIRFPPKGQVLLFVSINKTYKYLSAQATIRTNITIYKKSGLLVKKKWTSGILINL